MSAALALAAMLPAAAQSAADRELQVEAAFLVNFVRYCDWPPQRFDDPASPYVLAVIGSESTVATLSAVAAAAGSIQGRRIEVRRVDYARNARPSRQSILASQLRDSDLVFIHHAADAPPQDVLRMLARAPVLTVSDAPGFAEEGGMLGLVRSGRRLAFEANPTAIRAANLVVSAKVLKLARIRGSVP